MTDLFCTTGTSPTSNFLQKLEDISGSAINSSWLYETSSTYIRTGQKIEFTTNNHYHIYGRTPLFENSNNENRLLTKREVASFLNISIKMIDRKVSLNEIPFLKIGKLVRFDKEVVLRWAKENISKRK